MFYAVIYTWRYANIEGGRGAFQGKHIWMSRHILSLTSLFLNQQVATRERVVEDFQRVAKFCPENTKDCFNGLIKENVVQKIKI